jgi:hypothetical protein
VRRIGAHGLDAQKLAELVEPGGVQSAHRRESRQTGRLGGSGPPFRAIAKLGPLPMIRSR